MKERTYIAIDLKSFYASVECRERGLDPLNTNLVVADESRTDKTICLAMSGLNTSALRYLLEDDYEMDAVTQMLIPMLTGNAYDAASYAGMREEFRAYLAETDLLTLQ